MKELMETLNPGGDFFVYLIIGVIAVVATVAIFCFVTNRFLILCERWRLNAKSQGGTRRFTQPRTWLKLLPRNVFALRVEIMTGKGVREFFTPSVESIVEREEKRIYLQNAWLSAYPLPIRASVRQNKHQLAKKHLKARQQINELSKRIITQPLPEDVFIGGDREKHFLVEFLLDQHTRASVEALGEDLRSTLKAESAERLPADKYDRVSWIVHKIPAEDVLAERKFGVEFFEENPAESPYSLPLALQENGKPWCLDLHHTLIYGMTGSGKGGPIQGSIRQLAPFVHGGTVKLYGIDPKGPELGAYAKKGVHMFERISIGLAERNIRQHVQTINEIAAIISEREANLEPNFNVGEENLNRSLDATKKTPWVVLFIDEYLTLVKGLKKLGKDGAAPIDTLVQIMATGRSFGVYVILATQVATKEVFGDVRDNVPNAIVFKHKAGDYWTTEFLGEDALENGHNPKKIGASNKANGYKTAGIGFVSTPEGIVRVRFGYLSDKDIIEVAKQFMDEDADESVFDEPTPYFDPKKYGLGLTQEEADKLDGIAQSGDDDEDDDGDFSIREVDPDDGDDFDAALRNYGKPRNRGI